MLLPQVKRETCNEIIELFRGERSIVSILDEIEGEIDAGNPHLNGFLQMLCCSTAKYFEDEGDPVLASVAGRLGVCAVYRAVERTFASQKIPMPHISRETIDSYYQSICEEFSGENGDVNVPVKYLNQLAIDNPSIANLLTHITTCSPNQLCAEISIITGATTYLLLGRQLEADLLETMLESNA